MQHGGKHRLTGVIVAVEELRCQLLKTRLPLSECRVGGQVIENVIGIAGEAIQGVYGGPL